MFNMQVGIVKTGVSQQAQMFVNGHALQINQIFGVNYNGYMVVEEHAQHLGPSGSNHFLHIVGVPNGNHYTITVHVPFNNMGTPMIIESRVGTVNAYQHGYGQQYGNQGFIFSQGNQGFNGGFNNHQQGNHHGHHGHHGNHGHHGHGHH
jgi:hypothetical protein